MFGLLKKKRKAIRHQAMIKEINRCSLALLVRLGIEVDINDGKIVDYRRF